MGLIKTHRPLSKSQADLPAPDRSATVEEVSESISQVVDYLNFFNKSVSIRSNFGGFIVEVKFAAAGDAAGNDTQKIEHFLGFVPKYRIILRQTGNGVLEDIPSGWNDKFITIKNRGSEAATATFLLARE